MRSTTTLDPHFADKGADFFTPAHLLAMRMGTLNIMGKDNPQGFAQALTRPGPFRDALHSVGSEPTEGNDHIQQALNWFNGGMTGILPDETLTEIRNPHKIHERDLSLPRQREIMGEGVYAARGAGIARPELAALNRNLSREMPAIREHIRASAEIDLRQGPKGERTALGLSHAFAIDYPRGGVFVDGRYYNPYDPQSPASRRGTGTSEQDFINLFPDARTAGLLSNLAGQNLPGLFYDAMGVGVAPEISEAVSQNFIVSQEMQGGSRTQNVRIETLDADQGRYRLTGFLGASSSNSESAVERFMYEVSVDVNLGAPGLDDASRPEPSVEDVRLDMLFRGREAVPGEE
jgi:hypothetical protein